MLAASSYDPRGAIVLIHIFSCYFTVYQAFGIISVFFRTSLAECRLKMKCAADAEEKKRAPDAKEKKCAGKKRTAGAEEK